MSSCCPFGSAQGKLFRLSAFASPTISYSPGNCVFLAVHLVRFIRDFDPDTLSSLPVSALNVWFAVTLTGYRRRLRAFLYPGDRDSTRQLLHSCSERSRTYWLSLSHTPVSSPFRKLTFTRLTKVHLITHIVLRLARLSVGDTVRLGLYLPCFSPRQPKLAAQPESGVYPLPGRDVIL